MDRDAIRGAAVSNQTFAGRHQHHKQSAVVNFALAMLDGVAADGRELDMWESSCLLQALGAIYTNWFTLAMGAVQKALADPESRARGWEATLAHEAPSVHAMRDAFDLARHRAVPA